MTSTSSNYYIMTPVGAKWNRLHFPLLPFISTKVKLTLT